MPELYFIGAGAVVAIVGALAALFVSHDEPADEGVSIDLDTMGG